MNAVAFEHGPAIQVQLMRSGDRSCCQAEMDADWGGLETLLAAAEFVESQEQRKSEKLIEICEEYPTSEKNFSTESASSLTPVQNATQTGSSTIPLTASATTKNVLRAPSKAAVGAASANSFSRSVITSAVSPFASLTNGSSVPPAMVVSTQLPSFSPSPSLTFTFTTPSPSANRTGPSLLKIPLPSVRIPAPAATATSPRHYPTPLVIQSTNDVSSYSPPPPPPPPPASSISTARTMPQQAPLSQSTTTSATSSVSSLPHRTFPVVERLPAANESKRKLSNSGTREVHNKLEKNRRAHLKECFELLKSQVPAIQDEKKPSNLTILRTAIRYVQILRRREQELESELERLAREKIVNQQRLTTLKKELSAQWDHIDFNSLLPDTIESAKAAGNVENGADHHKNYEMDRDADKMAMSDVDDASSHVKSRAGDTYYGSSSPTGSCSISPLHISSPSVVTTVSDTLHPQIHIVETSPTSLDKLKGATVVSPLQFLSTSALRTIADAEQPIALLQHNGEGGGDKLSESATLPKVAVHAGNTFTIFSDSFEKANVAAATSSGGGSASHTTAAAAAATASAKLSSPSVQFASGLTLPTVAVSHKNMALSVRPAVTHKARDGTITGYCIGDKGSNTVLSTVGNIVNHSFVVTQPSSGQMLISTTPPHLPTNIMPTPPLLKTVSRLQPINGHQLGMKPTTAAVVVVSSSTGASK